MKRLVVVIFATLLAWFAIVAIFAEGIEPVEDTDHGCGYRGCNIGRRDFLNVHLIPHTHDDVGWLKTVDQYYYGDKNNIQQAGVQYILDSVITELLRDKSRRFTYVEIAYFERWWSEQSSSMKQIVYDLVQADRLQFVLGGWSMNDEATTHYSAIIDQITLGIKFLNKTFGDCGRPRVAWQIDTFGHSIQQAEVFVDMGFDAVFFQRLHYAEKLARLRSRSMELLWQANSKKYLFTSILYDTYCPPKNFCFDQLCNDQPIMEHAGQANRSIRDQVDSFIRYVTTQSLFYTSNHILVPMGCDFHYQNANLNYKNIDKLIKYVNARQACKSRINVFYSTPSCYTLAVNLERHTYPVKTSDFYPYANRQHSYWTGYFSSRAALKGMVRQSNVYLQATKQISALTFVDNNVQAYVEAGRRALALLQHHDAVSGTSKQAVSYDYALRLDKANKLMDNVWNKLLNTVVKPDPNSSAYAWHRCMLANISRCDVLNKQKSFVLAVYNPLTWRIKRLLSIPVLCPLTWSITDANGTTIDTQLVPVDDRTANIPERGRNTMTNCTLLFFLELKRFQLRTVFVRSEPLSSDEQLPINFSPINTNFKFFSERLSLENRILSAEFQVFPALMVSLRNKQSNITIGVEQQLKYYFGYSTNDSSPASGIYVFRPQNNSSIQNFSNPIWTGMLCGKICCQLYQQFSPWATQIIRLCFDKFHYAFDYSMNENMLEIEWTIGPIPHEDLKGREIVSHYSTNMSTMNFFYTDTNGRQTIRRKLNGQTYPFVQTEPIAANYYPVASKIGLLDVRASSKLKIFTDRSEGGSSLSNGALELMLHRFTMLDDGFGVEEPLQERGSDGDGLIVRGKHYIQLENMEQSKMKTRMTETDMLMQPIVFVRPLNNSILLKDVSFLTQRTLPPYLHILTIDNWINNTKILLRLENLCCISSCSVIKLNISDLFDSVNVTAFETMNLAASRTLAETRRLPWLKKLRERTDDNSKNQDGGNTNTVNRSHRPTPKNNQANPILLNPGEIGTFIVDVQKLASF